MGTLADIFKRVQSGESTSDKKHYTLNEELGLLFIHAQRVLLKYICVCGEVIEDKKSICEALEKMVERPKSSIQYKIFEQSPVRITDKKKDLRGTFQYYFPLNKNGVRDLNSPHKNVEAVLKEVFKKYETSYKSKEDCYERIFTTYNRWQNNFIKAINNDVEMPEEIKNKLNEYIIDKDQFIENIRDCFINLEEEMNM